MQIHIPLMETFNKIVDGEIETNNIIEQVDKAINSSLNEWTDKSFDL